ncbi:MULTISPECIES: hypothetical protein [Flavobacterium]|uniref:Uncharacterized protein n=1 Tax=Flavobacterium keumense TaxID=1306518 RepID=A0ABY8N2B8_9FLAO|nr:MULTISPECIES: hypothetical protein [Flavobacterium]WGK93795.1 hypothetical protein MG292_06740 [Flavobacterium keumense]
MESNLNKETIEDQDQNPNADLQDQNNIENNENKDTDLNNDPVDNSELALAYLRENGIEVSSIEDLKKQPEKVVEKVEVNPYEDLLDDDDKAYLNFKKETGRSRKEFEALNYDLDNLPKIDLAREKVRKETGLNFSDEEVDEYISESLGIDLEDMSVSDKIKLASFTKSILDEKKAEQEKYRKPVEAAQPESKEENTEQEWVKLDNGAVMLKSEYEKLTNTRQQEILKAKESVNSVTDSDFKITIDDKGTQKELNFTYEYSEEDRQSMVSLVSDIDGVIQSRYGSENGFNHKNFAEDMQWSDPKFREKAIASLLHKAIADRTEGLLKERGNVNFSQDPLQKQTKEGVKMVSVIDAIKGNY